MKSIAIMGFGVIGGGVYDVITENQEIVKKNVGDDVRIKYILDLREFPDHPAAGLITHNVDDIINDPEVSVVVETMGGVNPAFAFEMRALEAGKSVVTSNKELVESKGPELFAAAKAHNVNFFYEASVGGGIPVIRAMTECLTADRITEVSGILNGTTNYILTSMDDEGVSYEDALKQAQELGYAEKDPTADVEGHDAGRKIAILASMVTGKKVAFEDLPCEGISQISSADFAYAKLLKMSVKLIATAYFRGDKVVALVAPRFVPRSNALYGVNDVYNAVNIVGNMVDNIMLFGRGAGSHATASAVVGDVIKALKTDGNIYEGWSDEKVAIYDTGDSVGEIFVRVKGGLDKADKLTEIFGGGRVLDAGIEGEFAFVTPAITEDEVAAKLNQIDGVIKTLIIK